MVSINDHLLIYYFCLCWIIILLFYSFPFKYYTNRHHFIIYHLATTTFCHFPQQNYSFPTNSFSIHKHHKAVNYSYFARKALAMVSLMFTDHCHFVVLYNCHCIYENWWHLMMINLCISIFVYLQSCLVANYSLYSLAWYRSHIYFRVVFIYYYDHKYFPYSCLYKIYFHDY